jgi:small subunit ribosomal protein S11
MANETPEIAEAPEAAAPVVAPVAPAADPTPAPAPVAAVAPAPAEPARPQTINDVFLSLDGGAGDASPKITKIKGSKNISQAIVVVHATFNNTMVTITDRSGNVISWSTAGKMGFRGSRKGTAYAAQVVSQDACRVAMGHGVREAEVRLCGPGSGRESAVRAVQAIGIEVLTVKDITPMPHNGCRPPRARRV